MPSVGMHEGPLFHTTDAAQAILKSGFRDGTGSYGLASTTLTGVFVSNQPLTVNEGASGEEVLEIVLPDGVDLSDFDELIEELTSHREWIIPADVLNRGQIRLLSEEEIDQLT